MTDTSTLQVETRQLVAYGVERYEDSVTYGAIRRYLGDIGAVPKAAWGSLPGVSDRLARDWQVSVDARVDEAITARTEMDRVADGLLQIATDYEGTDLTVETSFDTVNRDLAPYLPVSDGYVPGISTRRGGSGTILPPRDRHQLGDERPTVVIPPGNEKLTATRHETLPSTRAVEEPITIAPPTATTSASAAAGPPTTRTARRTAWTSSSRTTAASSCNSKRSSPTSAPASACPSTT